MMLDLSVTGSVAPGAALFVYFTEFSNQGWIEAILEAITGDNAISVISISYGSPEKIYRWFRRFVRRFMFQTIHVVALLLV